MQTDFSQWRPVPSHSGAMNAHRGLVLHVQVGNGSCFGEFNNPGNKASSTWWVAKSGLIEQYVDSDIVAWTQGTGNGSWNGVETEGFPSEPLTPEQLVSLARIYAWGHSHYGWPLAPSDSPSVSGFGWHGMGGQPWGGHLQCPGDIRKAQRQSILYLAGESAAHPPQTQEQVMIAGTPSGKGYRVAKPDGSVWCYGDAKYHGGANKGAPARANVAGQPDVQGSLGTWLPAGHTVTGIATWDETTLDGDGGYWLITDFGGVYAYGLAPFLGGPNQ